MDGVPNHCPSRLECEFLAQDPKPLFGSDFFLPRDNSVEWSCIVQGKSCLEEDSTYLPTYLPTYPPTYLSFYLSIYSCCSHLEHSIHETLVPLQFLNVRQAVRFLGWGISPWQGRYPHTEQHKHRINAHRHPCLEWDSNPWSQCSSGRRRFMP
jgi:hypothetical protein